MNTNNTNKTERLFRSIKETITHSLEYDRLYECRVSLFVKDSYKPKKVFVFTGELLEKDLLEKELLEKDLTNEVQLLLNDSVNFTVTIVNEFHDFDEDET